MTPPSSSIRGAQAPADCPDCGHPEHFHRANTIDQLRKLDDPIPCFYVTGITTARGPGPSTVYQFCGCIRP